MLYSQAGLEVDFAKSALFKRHAAIYLTNRHGHIDTLSQATPFNLNHITVPADAILIGVYLICHDLSHAFTRYM